MSVLVVKGEVIPTRFMLRELRRRGYHVDKVDTGKRALNRFRTADLVLLDLERPDIDGLEVCRSIRAACDTPVISFARQGSQLEPVLALQAGSDDCVRTGCSAFEIMARIEAVLRRAHPQSTMSSQVISIAPLHIDPQTREVDLDDQAVRVTAKEFDLLYALASCPGEVLSRLDLMTRVWGTEWIGSRTLDTHVSSLRSKLGASEWIITVRGVGYRIGHGPRSARHGNGPSAAVPRLAFG